MPRDALSNLNFSTWWFHKSQICNISNEFSQFHKSQFCNVMLGNMYNKYGIYYSVGNSLSFLGCHPLPIKSSMVSPASLSRGLRLQCCSHTCKHGHPLITSNLHEGCFEISYPYIYFNSSSLVNIQVAIIVSTQPNEPCGRWTHVHRIYCGRYCWIKC